MDVNKSSKKRNSVGMTLRKNKLEKIIFKNQTKDRSR